MTQTPLATNYHPLVRQVARALRTRCAVSAGSRIVVGCSGGADSVALLRALALLAERRRWGLTLIVGHVHHHLRAADADMDAAFVGRLASELGLGYERRDIRPADLPGNTEANARLLRYRALADIAQQRDARYIATAHHADDQLETLLMRLIRGTSAAGLRGIAWRRRLRTPEPSERLYVIRPLLAVQRIQATDFLKTLGQPWREDATNLDTTRTRAKLRHDIIPRIKALRADAPDKAVALGEHFDQLHRLVQEQLPALGSTLDELPRDKARALNPIVLTQLLRRDLIRAGVSADRLPGHALHPVIEAVRDREGGTRSFEFASGVTIQIGPKTVTVTQRAQAK